MMKCDKCGSELSDGQSLLGYLKLHSEGKLLYPDWIRWVERMLEVEKRQTEEQVVTVFKKASVGMDAPDQMRTPEYPKAKPPVKWQNAREPDTPEYPGWTE